MLRTAAVAMIVAAAYVQADAETITNYTESFSGLNTSSATFSPRGWKHKLGSEWYPMTYNSFTTGGHTTGYLEATEQNSYYIDAFISPAVTGDCSIWVKKTAENGKISFYTSSDGQTLGYSFSSSTPYSGTVQGLDDLAVGEWKQVTLPAVPAGTYLAIAASKCGICDFTAASAEVNFVTKLSLSVSKTSYDNLYADSNNRVTIPFKVSISNVGDNDIEANTPGFKISVVNATNNNTPFGEIPVTVAIPRGTTVEFESELNGDATLAPNTSSNSFVFTESLTQSYDNVYYTIIPFAPVYNFVMAENGTHPISSEISFGMRTAEQTRNFFVYNSGTDAMNITGITVTGDFEVTSPLTGAVAAKANFPVNVRYKASQTGMAQGTLTISTDKLGDFTYNLQGLKRDAAKYFESFEGQDIPAGYIADPNWRISSDVADFQEEGNLSWIAQSYSSKQNLTMPLIEFADDDYLYIYANKSDNMSGEIEVFTSPDRANWTSVYSIGAMRSEYGSNDDDDYFSNEPPSETGTGYGKYAFRIFRIPMTTGQQYVRFSAGGVRIHDIYGGTRVPVDHDILYLTQKAPAAAMTNNVYTASIDFRNLATADEDNYAVSLIVDGEAVATAEAPVFVSGETRTFNVAYTPHETGTFNSCFRFTAGDFSLDSPEFQLTVSPEVASTTMQVGEMLISSEGPLNPYYNHSVSQVIYPADALGISANTDITGMHYFAYLSGATSGRMRVWMENTSDTGYNTINPVARDTEDMTLVFDSNINQEAVGTTSSIDAMADIFRLNFDEPFTYTGGNLRVMIQFDNTSGSYKNAFWAFDNSYRPDADKMIKFQTDRDLDDLDLEWNWNVNSYGFPVTFFDIAKEGAPVSGTVTDIATSLPIAGAKVTFTSDDVIYSATTDEAGNYAVTVYQAERIYDAVAAHENYFSSTTPTLTFTAGTTPNVVNFALTFDPTTGISDIELGENEPLDVFTTTGLQLLRGAVKSDLERLPAGVYIVRTPRGTAKIRR